MYCVREEYVLCLLLIPFYYKNIKVKKNIIIKILLLLLLMLIPLLEILSILKYKK